MEVDHVSPIHHGGNSLGNAANLHVSIPMRNTTRSGMPLAGAARKRRLAGSGTPDAEGTARVPANPDLGCGTGMDPIARERIGAPEQGRGRRQPTGLGSGLRTVPPHSCSISPPATVSGAPAGSCTSTSGRSRRIRSSTPSAP